MSGYEKRSVGNYCGFAAVLLAAVLLISTTAQAWMWVSGSNIVDQSGVYGTKGVAEPDNMPGARGGSNSWIDDSDNLWLFGGYGHVASGTDGLLNDLWKFDGTNWTWVSGTNVTNQNGVYGTKGVADSNNVPGARSGSISWKDGSGNLWLFGGGGYGASGSQGKLNDLWKYNLSSGLWTWVSGPNTTNQYGVYGTKGVADANNVPGSRQVSYSWIDGSGNLWLFGGYGYAASGFTDELNDLWKFDGTNWTWVSGPNTTHQYGIYGTKGVANPNNVPGARQLGSSWIDGYGNLWLFGGYGCSASSFGRLNDLWKFDGTDWTWVSGSNSPNQYGTYGTKGLAEQNNVPGGRSANISWIDDSDNLWLFGEYGYAASGGEDHLNDLWKYNLLSGLWTWVSGSNTTNQYGVYGTKGVPDPNNVPGAREAGISWKDSSGNLWLFEGVGYSASGNLGHLNDLWKFEIATAQQPFPEHNSSIGTDPNGVLVLSWKPGKYANKHNVYYGTNLSSLPEVSDQQDANSYAVNTELKVAYYWRIDEVNTVTATTVTGDIWKFTVDYLKMDDFEDYADTAALQAVWKTSDSITDVNATSDVNDYTRNIRYSGSQAMRVRYSLIGSSDSNATGEVYRRFASPQDWTENATGAKALTLWMRGMSINGPIKKMYVVLTDSSNVLSNKLYHPDASAVATSVDWAVWRMKLSDFENGSFDRSEVNAISIGVDNTIGGGGGGGGGYSFAEDEGEPNNGVFWVDGVTLNGSGCAPEIDPTNPEAPASDITDDCVVNFNDLARITTDWTHQDSKPVPNGIVYNSNDSNWVAGKFGNGLRFDGKNDWVDIDDLALPDFNEGTVSFWVKRDGAPPQGAYTYIFGTSEIDSQMTEFEWPLNVRLNSDGKVQAVTGTLEPGPLATVLIGNQTWTHIALVLEPLSGTAVTCYFYVGGTLRGTRDSDPYHHTDAEHGGLLGTCIGALKNGLQQWAKIAIDDFRIYNVTLSSSDIALLKDDNINTNPTAGPIIRYDFDEIAGAIAVQSGSISGVYHFVGYPPVPGSQANIYDKESPPGQVGQAINLRDYARLAKYWQYTIAPYP